MRALGDEHLEERLQIVGRCEARLAAVRAETVAALARRDGEARAADVLRNDLKQSRGYAQRIAPAARDRACAGCGAANSFCQPHHIIHWEHGGPTDIDNLCLLCGDCHHKPVH